MRTHSHFGALVLATLATAGLSSTAVAQGGPPPTPVRVDAAVQQEVQSMRRVSGEIRAKRRSMVAVREAGLVSELLVREGQRVEAGEVIARLDPQRLDDELAVLLAELPQAHASVGEQLALLEQVQNDLEVLEELSQRDAVNPKELADARSAVAVAQARTERAKTAVGLIEARIARLEHRIMDMSPTAPFDGVVVTRTTEVGQWLAAGATIVELVADTELEVRVDVPQSYYGPLTSLDGAIELEVTAAGRRSSTSWRVVPQIASTGRTFPLIVDLEDATGLAPGMSVTAEVPTGERAQQLTVSRDAILRGATGSHVFVAQPGAEEGAPHSATIAPVEVLFYLGDRAVVRSRAVQAGALVVVEGNERLYPTAPVAPMEAGEQGQQGGPPRGSGSGKGPTEGGQAMRTIDTPRPSGLAVTIVTSWLDAEATDIESNVVEPQEAALRELAGVERTESTTSHGSALVVVNFAEGTGRSDALDAIRAALTPLSYPEGVSTPEIAPLVEPTIEDSGQ